MPAYAAALIILAAVGVASLLSWLALADIDRKLADSIVTVLRWRRATRTITILHSAAMTAILVLALHFYDVVR